MAANTSIEWADDSISFWHGCEKVAPGCKFCYAEALDRRFGLEIWGGAKPRLWIKSAAEEVRRMDRKAAKEGRPRIVFINSMSDFFEDHSWPVIDRRGFPLMRCADGAIVPYMPCVPHESMTLADLRADAFRLFDACPHLRFLLLTKRPENVRRMWPSYFPGGYIAEAGAMNQEGARPNVWLGTSISDQATADRAIPRLLEFRDLCPVLFVSAEPLLGPVDIDSWIYAQWRNGRKLSWPKGSMIPAGTPDQYAIRCERGLDWLIVGGESGPGARPCNVAWVRALVAQCRAAGTACFVKQLGSHPIQGGDFQRKTGCIEGVRLRDSKGGDPAEWETDLRVREFPATEAAHA